MEHSAKLILDGKEYTMPVIVGTEGEKAIDISNLRDLTGYITLDSGFKNTGIGQSGITYVDGEKGVLHYRGYPIEQLAEKSSFTEVAYLLIKGELPTKKQLDEWRLGLTRHSIIHEDMRHFFDGFPPNGHPMAILSSMVGSLSTYYPTSQDLNADQDIHFTRLISKVRTIAAFAYKKSIGHPMIYPRNDLSYCANFLHMMFANPAEPYEPDPKLVDALNALLVLHADHEQNCSTSTVRIVGSSQASIYSAVSAGILALWGPLHGGANQAVIEMLKEIHASGGDYKGFMRQVKDKKSGRRLMGFGHRVYKSYDPRAKILKKMTATLLPHLGIQDPLLDIARNLEEIALADDFFIERNLYPNVDFYTGIIYRAMGIPEDMFTIMFALGRLPGWIAHWVDMMKDPKRVIARPRQIYAGPVNRQYIPLDKRT